jgi:hypothetical protein
MFRFATKNDKALFAVGIISTVAMGIAFPIFYFFMGNIVNSFGEENSEQEGR